MPSVEKVILKPRKPAMSLDGRMRLGPRIGEGGSALVIEAYDGNLQRPVATKMVREELADDEDTLRRISEEAQITAQLEHPNIVPVHELGITASGQLFFSMKLVCGRTWAEILEDNSYDPSDGRALQRQLQIFIKVCDAVAFAHSRGVIHRDLKPENVMVGDFGEVYVTDWGVAKILHREATLVHAIEPLVANEEGDHTSEDGLVIGTPSYMSPEQALARNDLVDERSDVFCLGSILYEILTKVPPYALGNLREKVLRAQQADIAPPQRCRGHYLPKQLCEIAMVALRLEPDHRYASALELKEQVEDFMQGGWRFPKRVYPAGSMIVEEGDPGEEAFFIVEGKCQVFKTVAGGRVDRGTMGPGEVFGETAIFTTKPRTASVQAIDEVTTLVVTSADFEQEMNLGGWIGNFAKALAERFREADARIADLERKVDLLTYAAEVGDGS